LDEVQTNGIDRETFERCRRVLYADEVRAYDSTEEIAENLLSFVFDGAELFDYPTLLQEVTLEQVEALMREVFRRDLTVLSVIEPFEKNEQEVI
jgi:predicted Zn-dependent peptidase